MKAQADSSPEEAPALAERTLRLLAPREAEERSLRRVCLAVARDGEPEEIFDLVAREVAEPVGASGGLVVRFDRRTRPRWSVPT